MRKTVLVFGTISGAVVILSMIVGISMAAGDDSAGFSPIIGYLIMIVALSAIFIGTKRYRDQELGGVIKFGKAFLLGLGISAVAGVIYVTGWEIYLSFTDHAFIEQYTDIMVESKRAAGMAGEELESYVASMNTLKEQYANPVFRVPMTFMEIFPVGLVISLISALILRKSEVLPATA